MHSDAERRAPITRADILLSEEASLFLASLPAEVAPAKLADAFPHIANKIASLWKIPRQLDPYLDSLIIDDRGGRQGFPAPIAWEILRLKDYYQSVVYPMPSSRWDSVI